MWLEHQMEYDIIQQVHRKNFSFIKILIGCAKYGKEEIAELLAC